MKITHIYALGVGLLPVVHAHSQDIRPNVLFIIVDDLRPELGCFGAEYMHTPNIDAVAGRGTVFQRAYCQQAVSAASRNSVLTGLRPDGLGIYNLSTFFRRHVPDVVTLPQHFRQNGYITEGCGKVYHVGHGNIDDSLSWDVKWDPDTILPRPEPITRGDTAGLETDYPRLRRAKRQLGYYASDTPEENMKDARTVKVVTDRLKELKDETFFMAVGLVKPHLPFVAPRKYWEYYNEDDIVVPSTNLPEGMPSQALTTSNEIRKYAGVPSEGLLGAEQSRKFIHGYRACVSYIDNQIGILLATLEDIGLADNTIVVIWGDHGWKLGEYGAWSKHSNMELDTNAPLIISAPGYTSPQKSDSLVEFVDIYPTICELAGLPLPDHLQGCSLLPVLENSAAKVKDVAISQYPRGDHKKYRSNIYEQMGYSMRTDRYRYTRWVDLSTLDNKTVAVELYDQSENKPVDRNLALLPEYRALTKKLDSLLTKELAKYKVFQRDALVQDN